MRRLPPALLVPVVAAVVAGTLLGGAGCGAPPRPRFVTPSATPAAAPASAPGTSGPPGASPSPTTSPSASPSPTPATGTACPFFPAGNVWHADVSALPVHRSSAAYVEAMGSARPVHPDFGSGLVDGAPFGIPITTVPAGQPGVPVTFDYAAESDRGPYPVPRDAAVEGGPNATGDRHVIVVAPDTCKAYELFDAHPRADGSWHAGSGAVYDLRSNRLRPAGWTSADAAGLPIVAGLVRYDEAAAGRIDHAVRMTAPATRNQYLWPARHAASSRSDANLPPMGLRLRLKAGVDISRFPPQARAVAQALKRYGAIIADNGSAWYLSGTQDARWSNDALNALKSLHGSDFEAVDESGLMVDPNSAATH